MTQPASLGNLGHGSSRPDSRAGLGYGQTQNKNHAPRQTASSYPYKEEDEFEDVDISDIPLDVQKKIRKVVKVWLNNKNIDVIISTGGTGLTGRDVSPEAFRGLFNKEIEGFGELFRYLSFKKIGTSTVQSRALAGVSNGKYIFVLPGSPSACKDAWDEILFYQLDYRHKPCNFVEIMPRLDEQLRRK